MVLLISLNREKIKTYAVSVFIPLALGAVVGLLISGFMDYDSLRQPPLAPPAVLFPIVWTLLYALMGVSYGILRDKGLDDQGARRVYCAQLAVNLLWPVFFFVLKWRLFSFFWIAALAVLVIVMTVRFYRRDETAGLLQIPYTVWVLFASYLNLAAYILNG